MDTYINDIAEEWLPVVDSEGNTVGKASRTSCHDGSKRLHPVVHLHVFDRLGRLYLQLRPDWKSVQPGKWDTAVGGHVDFGETVSEALRREAIEELGLSVSDPVPLQPYKFESDIERELVYPFRTTVDSEPCPSAELAGGRFWTIEEIENALGEGSLTPNFEAEYRRLFMS